MEISAKLNYLHYRFALTITLELFNRHHFIPFSPQTLSFYALTFILPFNSHRLHTILTGKEQFFKFIKHGNKKKNEKEEEDKNAHSRCPLYLIRFDSAPLSRDKRQSKRFL